MYAVAFDLGRGQGLNANIADSSVLSGTPPAAPPLPKLPGSAGILPASAGTGRWEGKAISLDRCVGDACRLEGGAPDHGLLRPPPSVRR